MLMLGGPGAVFWMVFIAFFSMSAKFVSCTLGQLYRKVNDDGSISGGPMYYLSVGLKDRGFDSVGISSIAKIGLKELLFMISKEVRGNQ